MAVDDSETTWDLGEKKRREFSILSEAKTAPQKMLAIVKRRANLKRAKYSAEVGCCGRFRSPVASWPAQNTTLRRRGAHIWHDARTSISTNSCAGARLTRTRSALCMARDMVWMWHGQNNGLLFGPFWYKPTRDFAFRHLTVISSAMTSCQLGSSTRLR